MKKIVTTFAMLLFMLSIMAIAIGNVEAFKSISADTALKMYKGIGGTYDYYAEYPGGGSGTFDWPDGEEATIVDVRTLEEYYWVGTCAKDPNGMPIAYNIPYELWTYRIEKADGYYKPTMVTVKTLFKLFIRRTFPDKDTPLILFCRSGSRSDKAAVYLESMGYIEIYEIDKGYEIDDTVGGTPGKGGFQGSSTSPLSEHKGYRGWPGRWPVPDKSVSWMDTGLPVTQNLDPTKIYLYMWGKHYK